MNVRTPEQVEHADWGVVLVVGMNEGRLPWHVQENGLLGGSCGGVQVLGLPGAEVQNRAAEESLLEVLGAFRVGTRVVVSFSATDADHRLCLPSPLLQRLDDRLAEWQPNDKGEYERLSRFVPEKEDTLWCRKLAPEDLLPGPDSAVTEEEADVGLALEGRTQANRFPGQPALQRFLDPPAWTAPADPEARALTEFGAVPLDRGVTPSQLDEFGYCPYRYFAQCILQLDRLEDIELTPTPQDAGSVLHAALQATVDHVLADHDPEWFVCSDDDQLAERRRELRDVFKEKLSDHFDELTEGSMALDPLAVANVQRRWLKTVVNNTVDELVFSNERQNLQLAFGKLVTKIQGKIDAAQPAAQAFQDKFATALETALKQEKKRSAAERTLPVLGWYRNVVAGQEAPDLGSAPPYPDDAPKDQWKSLKARVNALRNAQMAEPALESFMRDFGAGWHKPRLAPELPNYKGDLERPRSERY